MLIALPIIFSVVVFKFVALETPIVDNTRTLYCVAKNTYSNGENIITEKTSCTRGSISVEKSVPSLAERKSK